MTHVAAPPGRAVLAATVGGAAVHEGVAEAIPLSDASVDAVAVADGFHWFDQAPALEEIRRVLTPGGGLAILTSIPDWSASSWAHDLGTKLGELRPEHPYFDGTPWQETVRAAGGWTEPREVRVIASQPTSPERIVAYVASMSWIAAMPEGERTKWLDEAASIVAAGETPPELKVTVIAGLTSLAERRG